MVVVMALGGSTNAVLHLIAMARAVGVPLTIDDFQKVSDRIPFLADLKPSGKYVQEDLHNVGGTPAVMKYLLEKGLLDGDCLTVTGKTLAENLARSAGPQSGAGGRVTRSKSPIKADRPYPDSARQPGARWRRGQDHGQGRRPLQRPGQGLRRRRGRCCTRWSGRRSTKATCHHPLRRPQGRARHARDAHAHLGHHGRRAGQRRGADHRRPIFRRIARLHRRPRHARGPGRRPDRAGRKRRPDHARRQGESHRASTSARPSWRRGGRSGRPRRTSSPAARCTSTSRT